MRASGSKTASNVAKASSKKPGWPNRRALLESDFSYSYKDGKAYYTYKGDLAADIHSGKRYFSTDGQAEYIYKDSKLGRFDPLRKKVRVSSGDVPPNQIRYFGEAPVYAIPTLESLVVPAAMFIGAVGVIAAASTEGLRNMGAQGMGAQNPIPGPEMETIKKLMSLNEETEELYRGFMES